METAIFVMLFIILLFLLTLSILFVYLLIQRGLEVKRQEKIAAYLKEKENDWYCYLIEGNKEVRFRLVPKEKVDYIAAERVLLTYKQNMYAEYTQQHIHDYAKDCLQSMYKKQLQSRRWSSRMNGLYRVLDFQMKELKEEVLHLLKKERLTKEEYLQICKILSRFHDAEWMNQLKEPRFPLGEYAYQKIVHELEEKQINLLTEEIDQLPPNLQYAILNWIGKHHDIQRYGLLENLARSEVQELRLRALKAMTETGYIPDQNKLKQLVESEIWEERLMAAKLLLFVQGKEAISWLTHLLEDSSWWVRKEAATSIVNRQNGKHTLRHIIQHSDDPFARDAGMETLRGVEQIEHSG